MTITVNDLVCLLRNIDTLKQILPRTGNAEAFRKQLAYMPNEQLGQILYAIDNLIQTAHVLGTGEVPVAGDPTAKHAADDWIAAQWMGKTVRHNQTGRTNKVIETTVDENGALHCKTEDNYWCPAIRLHVIE